MSKRRKFLDDLKKMKEVPPNKKVKILEDIRIKKYGKVKRILFKNENAESCSTSKNIILQCMEKSGIDTLQDLENTSEDLASATNIIDTTFNGNAEDNIEFLQQVSISPISVIFNPLSLAVLCQLQLNENLNRPILSSKLDDIRSQGDTFELVNEEHSISKNTTETYNPLSLAVLCQIHISAVEEAVTLQNGTTLSHQLHPCNVRKSAFGPKPSTSSHKNELKNDGNENIALRRRSKPNPSHFDFISSDDEPFEYTSSSAVISDASSDEGEADKTKRVKKKKKLKKRKTESNENIKEDQIFLKKKKKTMDAENKNYKEQRKAYYNSKGIVVKEAKMGPNPCIGKKCGNNCGDISEEKRESIFTYFNNLGSQQRRRDWIAQCAIKKNLKSSEDEKTRRNVTYNYFINNLEGRRQVCQQFLISTLDITQKFILYTLSHAEENLSKLDARGKNVPTNKNAEYMYNQARTFILSLPLVPSHYTRKESTKLYLPQETKSLANLYRKYLLYCEENTITKTLSEKCFITWFKSTFNISIHRPKKDKCSFCVKYQHKVNKTDVDEHAKKQHDIERKAARDRFTIHQTLHDKTKSTLCASFDLQKVLNTPHGESMLLYYSRKYAVFNFTVYESGTKQGYCYVWGESDARRGANEIATCMQKYILSVDARKNIKTLILYCDSCSGQNRNRTMLSMIFYILQKLCKHIEVIQINYLIPGHTEMPVDSMHSCIEKESKGTIVWAPSEWPRIIASARKRPFKYNVLKMYGRDFNSYEDILDKMFPAKSSQKIQFKKLRTATFKKKTPDYYKIKYSYHDDESVTMDLKKQSVLSASIKTNLYKKLLPISEAKYKDFQKKLIEKGVLPTMFCKEFSDIPHSKKTKDQLPETDSEDEN